MYNFIFFLFAKKILKNIYIIIITEKKILNYLL